MPDRPEIAPALTPQEWKDRQDYRADGYPPAAVYLIDGNLYVSFDGGVGEEVVDPDEVPKFIAFANAALPDDSPYKITHADVALLREIQVDVNSVYTLELSDEEAIRLRQLAAKLAALLPPESRDGDI